MQNYYPKIKLIYSSIVKFNIISSSRLKLKLKWVSVDSVKSN